VLSSFAAFPLKKRENLIAFSFGKCTDSMTRPSIKSKNRHPANSWTISAATVTTQTTTSTNPRFGTPAFARQRVATAKKVFAILADCDREPLQSTVRTGIRDHAERVERMLLKP